MICLVVNCQYAFRLSVIVLGELPVFPPRFDKVPLNLRGVQERSGRVMPAATEFNLGSVAESMGRMVGKTPLPVEETESGTAPMGIPEATSGGRAPPPPRFSLSPPHHFFFFAW